MLTSIIGYTLTVLFAGLSLVGLIATLRHAKRGDPEQLGKAFIIFSVFGLISLGTAYIAGL